MTPTIRLKIERDRQRSEAEVNRAYKEVLDAQAEAVRLQSQQAKRTSIPDPPTVSDSGFNRAVIAVQQRYPDFETYRVEAARLMGDLDTSKGAALNLEHYVEAMYLVAKHASFSTSAVTPPANALIATPEFQELPIATRVRLLKAVAPELSKWSDDDMETVLAAIDAKKKASK